MYGIFVQKCTININQIQVDIPYMDGMDELSVDFFQTPTWPIISKKTVNIRLPERIVDAVGNWKTFPKGSNPLKNP